ncbi:MAG TPA: HAD family phosphatase [Patescibacteria group bacterium]|jgi:epoxide hydrolase-like predicted phosphatase|nr:HAD family phosphatase [Patescibacteria group bacterium]
MIKAVIFDFGGVLVRTPSRQSREKWEKKLGLDEWESEIIVFSSEMGMKAQNGELTDQELWTWVGDYFSLSSRELNEFRTDFWAGDVLDQNLIKYIRSIRPEYQTAIISNATDALRNVLENEYPIADAFDLIVCSAEEKTMKPRPEIFERTLERLDRLPDETIFIDDSEPNILAARTIGMNAIHFKPTINLTAELYQAGITGGDHGLR